MSLCLLYYSSLCYHCDFLAGVLHQRSKLQASHFQNTMPNLVKDAAVIKLPGTKTDALLSSPVSLPMFSFLHSWSWNRQRKRSLVVWKKVLTSGKMKDFHDEVLNRMQHVGCRGYAANSAGTSYFIQVSSVNEVVWKILTISLPWSKGMRRHLISFILQVELCHIFQRGVCFNNDIGHSLNKLVLWKPK